jgi:catechol 2,3-dioxygenase-like lactoylglutathione lyase family enzyme
MDEARSTANGVPTPVAGNKFLVGGVRLDRPFRIRRLGHFGFNCYKYEEAVRFYTDLLGFEIADERDWSGRLTPEQKAKLAEIGAPAKGCFMRYGTDHHAMVISSRYMRDMTRPTDPSKKDITVNQITWQVGSLAEIVAAESWLRGQGVSIIRAGRDMPGSNWHVYFADPDGHTIELYWGMEQIGWDGLAKPLSMYDRAFEKAPPLPQISEYDEVEQAIAAGKDIHSGQRQRPRPQSRYDVQGVMLPRPFKITRIGPVRLFVADVAASLAFYRRICGFDVTEEVEILGRRCAFLRASGEHHALALYPKGLRKELGLSDHSTCLSFGVQLANYQQLRDARTFFRDKGWREVALPAALSPGIDYSFMVEDPDGHRIQLYHAMEQLGWEGKPRPASLRPKPVDGDWPEAIDPRSDTYLGEPYLGPWG